MQSIVRLLRSVKDSFFFERPPLPFRTHSSTAGIAVAGRRGDGDSERKADDGDGRQRKPHLCANGCELCTGFAVAVKMKLLSHPFRAKPAKRVGSIARSIELITE